MKLYFSYKSSILNAKLMKISVIGYLHCQILESDKIKSLIVLESLSDTNIIVDK